MQDRRSTTLDHSSHQRPTASEDLTERLAVTLQHRCDGENRRLMGLRDVDLRVLLGAQVQSLVAPHGQVELLEPPGGRAVQEAFDRDDSRLLEGIDLCRGDARSLHGIHHAGLDGDPVQRAGLVSVGVEEQRVVWPRVPTELRTKRPELLLKGMLDGVVVEVERPGHARYPPFSLVEVVGDGIHGR
jgi:hypothetical protein